jgi:tRNA-dihydrouridine synthase 3
LPKVIDQEPSIDDDHAETAKFNDDQSSTSKKDKRKGRAQKHGGANKDRHHGTWGDHFQLCPSRVRSNEFSPEECSFGTKCRFEHNLRRYLTKGKVGELDTLDGMCPTFEDQGFCPYGWKCRFSKSHSKEVKRDDGKTELILLIDEEKKARTSKSESGSDNPKVFNILSQQLKINLQRRRINLDRSDKYTDWVNEVWNKEINRQNNQKTRDQEDEISHPPDSERITEERQTGERNLQSQREESRASWKDPPFRPSEKRRLYYGADTPILAPLTTQGNLPFRRLCISLGAQITFSEMAMSMPIVQGENNEWALMKTHESEVSPPTLSSNAKVLPGYDNSKDLKFGAQIAANKPWAAFKTTEILSTYCPQLRVIDLNCGCPIDLVVNSGGGSALLDGPSKMEKMLRGMNALSGEIPVSCKIRMGTRDAKPNADSVVKRLVLGSSESKEAGLGPPGVAAITLHGRTRQQRYTKVADWGYISDIGALITRLQKEQADALDTAHEVDPRDLPNGGQTYFIGNGDVLSHADYFEHLADHKVDAVMVGRGALIKPWVFEEISTGQHLDKSSSERLEYIKQFVKLGLDTWGSDERGVGTTRRFLLEWLSFTHRYVPIGLLERLPPRINERPPLFKGRDDLETLMASTNYLDWLKIAEMFLGKAGDSFKFVPKHKSNSYEIEAEG